MVFRVGFEIAENDYYIQDKYNFKSNSPFVKIRRAFSVDGRYEFAYANEKIYNFSLTVKGIYKIEAWGATGGSSNDNTGPKGAYSKSFVELFEDEEVQILVGEKGWKSTCSGNNAYCGGGGGGTFIAKGKTPLCVAGGGGSYTYNSYSSQQSFSCGQKTELGGDPGTGKGAVKMGGNVGGTLAGGGGGFEGNGKGTASYGKGGYSFLNGGKRQTVTGKNYQAYGGFGGGGSNPGNCGYGAGGGGYTGGSASDNTDTQGGGGGSFFQGSFNGEKSLAFSGCESFPAKPTQDGNGFAVITLVKPNEDKLKDIPHYCYSGSIVYTFIQIMTTA